MSLTFNKKYFTAAIILFLIEVFIAVYIKDTLIRPYGGDFLVVIFLYCLLKSFFKIPVKNAVLWVLLFCWIIEIFQHLEILKHLGLSKNALLSVVLGNHFEWLDMFIYTLAASAILIFELARQRSFSRPGGSE